eukprot:3288158-Pyramimonas_sp.AAC.1
MAIAGPLYTWALLVRDTKVPGDILDNAFCQQRQSQRADIAGPADAVLVALQSPNWLPTMATTWSTCA